LVLKRGSTASVRSSQIRETKREKERERERKRKKKRKTKRKRKDEWTVLLRNTLCRFDAGRTKVDATFEIFEAVHVAGASAEYERDASALLRVKIPSVVGIAARARVHRQTAHSCFTTAR